MAFGGMVITSKGRNALIKAQNGGKLEFLHVAIGDGTYSGSFNSVSRLTNQLFTIPIVNIKTEKDTCILEADLNNTDFTNDFYLREIGIYVKDGDQPILYTYDNAGSDAQFISGGEDALIVEKRLRFVLTIADVENITAETASTLYTVQSDFIAHTSEQSVHVTSEKQSYWNNKLDDNGDASGLTSQFQTFTERENIEAGETLNNTLGKVRKWFADLKPHAFQQKIKNEDIEDLDASKLKGKIDLEVIPDGFWMERLYPIGALYLSTRNVNPADLIPGTEWIKFGQGRALVGVDDNNPAFNEVKKTGGAEVQTLTVDNLPSHSHNIGEHVHGLNAHSHSIPALSGTAASAGAHTHKYFCTPDYDGPVLDQWRPTTSEKGRTIYKNTSSSGAHTHTVKTTAGTTGNASGNTSKNTKFLSEVSGGDIAHNNLQPYITCYIWERIR